MSGVIEMEVLKELMHQLVGEFELFTGRSRILELRHSGYEQYDSFKCGDGVLFEHSIYCLYRQRKIGRCEMSKGPGYAKCLRELIYLTVCGLVHYETSEQNVPLRRFDYKRPGLHVCVLHARAR
jgi:hypothetical protein